MSYMNISDYLALNNDGRYAEMLRATIASMPLKYFKKHFKPTKKRWVDLVRVWDKVFNHDKQYVLTSAIHKIYWGVYPYKDSYPELQYLLELVEAELLDNGEAYKSWIEWTVFKRVLNGTLNSIHSFGNSHIALTFIEHYHYLKSRAYCKIVYDKEPSSNQYDTYINEYRSYEEIVKQLIPAAANWSHEQWANDCNVADELNKLYGVDYSNSYDKQRDYDRLIMMLRAKNDYGENSADVFWCASNITELPLDLARKIWPENLEFIAAHLLWSTYVMMTDYEKCGQPFSDRKDDIHPLYHYERKNVKNSWLFRAVSEWFYKGVYSGEEYTHMKTVIFDLNTTC